MATALQPTAVTCPKCGGPVWDQKLGKFWGNGLRSNGKQKPRWECKNKECGGAVWEEKNVVSAAPPKPSPTHSNVPNQQLPPLLQNQAEEDAAELAAKIGPPEKPKLTQLYLDATTFFLDRIVPKFEEKEIGLSDTAVVAGIATLFIAASKER